MKAKKRTDGRYCRTMTVVIDGKKTRKFFYGSSQAELTRQMREYEEQQTRGRTFAEVADEWWSEASQRISPNTYYSYKRGYERAVQYYSGVLIRSITPAMCNGYIIAVVKKYKMSQKTASNHRSVLNQIFIHGVCHGDIFVNPLRDIPIPPKLEKHPRPIASDEDIKKIKLSLDCTFGLYAYVALYTGLRRGELLALTWNDIDLDRRTISVNKSWYPLGNKGAIKEPKTKTAYRTVPILDRLLPVLAERRSEGYVFPGKLGGLMTSSEYDDAYSYYRRESGVSCSPHQLRHAYATMLFEQNISVKDAQRLLGHAQASTTQDIYQAIRKSHEIEVNEKLYAADI